MGKGPVSFLAAVVQNPEHSRGTIILMTKGLTNVDHHEINDNFICLRLQTYRFYLGVNKRRTYWTIRR